MSGHSHYATTHRQKEIKDAAKGQVFSKLARAITIAAKTGGGPNIDSNYKLRIAVDKARAVSMPKENIDRAISKASGAEAMDEVTFEGFGPGGIAVLVEAATDNRNRTTPEIRNLFEKHGGKMGTPGSVAFNFDPKGMLIVDKETDFDSQLLNLIDLGAEDVEDLENGEVAVYVAPHALGEIQKKVTDSGITVKSAELIQKPKSPQDLTGEDVEKVEKFIENLESHDDVQKVFSNASF